MTLDAGHTTYEKEEEENNTLSPAGVDLRYSMYVSYDDSYWGVAWRMGKAKFEYSSPHKEKKLCSCSSEISMYVVSPHITRREKNLSYNTDCQIPPHQARNVTISAALFYPRSNLFPFPETGGKRVKYYDILYKYK